MTDQMVRPGRVGEPGLVECALDDQRPAQAIGGLPVGPGEEVMDQLASERGERGGDEAGGYEAAGGEAGRSRSRWARARPARRATIPAA